MDFSRENLLKYYKFVLECENILSLGFKYVDIQTQSERNDQSINKIKSAYSKKLSDANKQNRIRRFSAINEVQKQLIYDQSEFNRFFEETTFFEKFINFCKTGKVRPATQLEESDEFIFGKRNYYQYCLIYGLIDSRPGCNKKHIDVIPVITVLFHNIDVNFNIITPDIIHEQIKKYLDVEFDKVKLENISFNEPIVTLNPKIVDSYNLTLVETKDLSAIELYVSVKNTLAKNQGNNSLDNLIDNIFLCTPNQNFTQGLMKFYNTMLNSTNNSLNKTLTEFLSVHNNKISGLSKVSIEPSAIINTKRIVQSYIEHYGAFDKQNTLKDSQRSALACYLTKSNIVPVNGAPGTGKTSLLRAIAGDYIVKASLKSYQIYKTNKAIVFQTPIVCSSTNNQALYNINEGIASGFHDAMKLNKSSLYTRWISHIELLDTDKKIESMDDDISENPDCMPSENKIDFSRDLYVPSIKSSSQNYFEMNKSTINTILASACKNTSHYFHSFELAYDKIPENFTSELEKLEYCLEILHSKLNENIEYIRQGVDLRQFENLSKLEDKIIQKYFPNDDMWFKKIFNKVINYNASSFKTLSDEIEKHIYTVKSSASLFQKIQLFFKLGPFYKEYCDLRRSIYNELSSVKSKRQFNNRLDKLILEYKNEIFLLEYIHLPYSFDYEDSLALHQFQDVYNDYIRITKQKAELDTSYRTDNFYIALHILETLYLIDNLDLHKEYKLAKCPKCEKGILLKSKNDYLCNNNCGCRFSLVNPSLNQKIKDLPETLLFKLLSEHRLELDGILYVTELNENFINVCEISKSSNLNFHKLLPVFPIINLTCNSFGTIISNTGEEFVDKDLFDFVLIDEAGTITPSKMAILYSAKQVMFFGDILQLKPVFIYDETIEKSLLRRFFSDSKDINNISTYFSCADNIQNNFIQRANNAMSVANNCSLFYLPYNFSKLEGDIWLKEHFRCRESIISISNELSYHNEVISCKPNDNFEHLIYCEHSYPRNAPTNTNLGEAQFIIKYIFTNMEKFKQQLKLEDDISYFKNIGIITPFANQHTLIETELSNSINPLTGIKDLRIKNVKVGTVHKYQGSERRIIIFSTVYNTTDSNPAQFFFNRNKDTSMINVAVTRAKDIFIVFGNKNVLLQGNTYSALMMKHILDE